MFCLHFCPESEQQTKHTQKNEIATLVVSRCEAKNEEYKNESVTVNRLRRARDTRVITASPFSESSAKWCVHIIIRLMASFLLPSQQQQQQQPQPQPPFAGTNLN